MIHAKTIMLTRAGNHPPEEVKTYLQVDASLRTTAATMDYGHYVQVNAVVVFEDLFIWRSFVSVTRSDVNAEHFIHRAIQADWEFNAAIRPS
jgi:hypothetical protein